MESTQTLPRDPGVFTPAGIARRAALVLGVIAAAVTLQITLHPGARLAPATLHWHAPHVGLLAQASPVIRLHLTAAILAFALGGLVLAGPKGTTWHKRLGWSWVLIMATVAISSFFITGLNPGHFSLIHGLSGYVCVALFLGVAAARRGRIRAHRHTMTGLFLGALVIAGAFTFAPGRLMYQVFFG